jgi:hypothetical protein
LAQTLRTIQLRGKASTVQLKLLYTTATEVLSVRV